ncbi:flippase [Photobacterium phosphoreum]|uniref:flippase n=1 Tax=Photobacterium phosphoreum TaxID=659 RepID=UPI00242FDC4A|nr:flippase [Photobacterium phosphoreum]
MSKIKVIISKLDTNFKKIIKNSLWLLFDKLSRMLLGLIVTAWVARYLGPSEYGVLSYSLAYIAFFQAVSLLGINNIVVRDISIDKVRVEKILGSAFYLRLVSGIFCWISAVIIFVVINGFDSKSVILVSILGLSLIFQSYDIIDLWFQSQSQSKRTVRVKLLSYFFSNGLKVILILNNASIIFFVFVITVEYIFSAIGLIFAYKKYTCGKKWLFDYKYSRELIGESWPYIISGLSASIYMRIDQVMIKNILGIKELGIYAAALPLSISWNFIPVILAMSFSPFIAKEKEKGSVAYERAIIMIFKLFYSLSLIICVITYFIAPYIVPLLYGEQYSGSVSVLQIHIFTNIFISLGVAQSLWIINEKKSSIILYQTLSGAIFSIILNYYFVLKFGLVGAAFVAVFSQLLSTVIMNLFFAKKIFILQIKTMFFIR